MSGLFEDGVEIVACAIRPEGSLGHLGVLIGFVVVAWWVGRRRERVG